MGDSTKITVEAATSLTILFLKAVVYFVISVQIDLVESAKFLKFYDGVLFDNLAAVMEIG